MKSGAILAERGNLLERYQGLEYIEKSLEIRRKGLGEEHELTQKSKNRLEAYRNNRLE